jgi:hypothetical protein
MIDLSPAAQAVINAAVEGGGGYGRATPVLHARIAAALRAAADQVVPSDPCGNKCCITEWELIRADFLAIVAELGNYNA